MLNNRIMKRYKLTESKLRNMIHEAVVSVLKEAAPVFGNNNQGYGITNNGDMRRGGTGKRRSFPLTYNWDDPEYADTARSSNSGREYNLRKESKARDTFNKAVKYGKKQLNKFNQSIKDLTDEYDEDGNPIIDNPMYKGKKSNNESRLRNMVRESVISALNEINSLQ